MTKNDGGPIHPPSIAVGPSGDLYFSDDYGRTGMSLRDWFAGQALVGLEAGGPHDGWTASHTATLAYQIADAMLKERARGDD